MSHGFRTVGLVCLTLVLVAAAPQGATATETADLTFVEASCRDAYLEVAGVWGLEIVFDPKFRGGRDRFNMEMKGVTALEALNRLALRVIQSEGKNVGAVPNRLTEDEFRRFTSRTGSNLLASFGMTLVGSRQSVLEIPASSGRRSLTRRPWTP